jgi:hypothetical protein
MVERCQNCRNDEHSECTHPAAFKGDSRGDNYELIRCCCTRSDRAGA